MPDSYIKGLKENVGFLIIKAKYEVLAKDDKISRRSKGSGGQSDSVSEEETSKHMVVQSHPDTLNLGNHAMGREAFVLTYTSISLPHSAVGL